MVVLFSESSVTGSESATALTAADVTRTLLELPLCGTGTVVLSVLEASAAEEEKSLDISEEELSIEAAEETLLLCDRSEDETEASLNAVEASEDDIISDESAAEDSTDEVTEDSDELPFSFPLSVLLLPKHPCIATTRTAAAAAYFKVFIFCPVFISVAYGIEF